MAARKPVKNITEDLDYVGVVKENDDENLDSVEQDRDSAGAAVGDITEKGEDKPAKWRATTKRVVTMSGRKMKEGSSQKVKAVTKPKPRKEAKAVDRSTTFDNVIAAQALTKEPYEVMWHAKSPHSELNQAQKGNQLISHSASITLAAKPWARMSEKEELSYQKHGCYPCHTHGLICSRDGKPCAECRAEGIPEVLCVEPPVAPDK